VNKWEEAAGRFDDRAEFAPAVVTRDDALLAALACRAFAGEPMGFGCHRCKRGADPYTTHKEGELCKRLTPYGKQKMRCGGTLRALYAGPEEGT